MFPWLLHEAGLPFTGVQGPTPCLCVLMHACWSPSPSPTLSPGQQLLLGGGPGSRQQRFLSGREYRQDCSWPGALSLWCVFYCLIGLHLQNPNTVMKVFEISRWHPQTTNCQVRAWLYWPLAKEAQTSHICQFPGSLVSLSSSDAPETLWTCESTILSHSLTRGREISKSIIRMILKVVEMLENDSTCYNPHSGELGI